MEGMGIRSSGKQPRTFDMSDYFNVSAIDPNEGASVEFVMCRSGGTDVQVGAGHIVDAAYVPRRSS
jgi:hypothetical protein